MLPPDTEALVRRALEEDIGTGDFTSMCTIDADRQAEGRFFARQPDCVVAGLEILPMIYEMRGGVDELRLGGARPEIAYVRGHARTLLECERVALNFLQRLSGVATNGRKYVDAVAGTKCRILDTRKTTPGWRNLEKMAAAAGGVHNHRMGLWDAILIKNNHLTAAGGVKAAWARVQACPDSAKAKRIEMEVRTRAELDDALECGVRHLLLDNLTPAEAAEWVRYIGDRAATEISGGVTLATVRAYAESGCDFISVGAITHSAVAVDINFRIEL